MLLALVGCSGDSGGVGSAGESTSTGEPTTGGQITATTIPVPMVTDSSGSTSPDGSSTAAADSSETGSSTADAVDSSSSGDTTGGSSSSETTESGPVTYDVSWCRLQFPSDIAVALGESFTIYVRFYAEGLTDQSPTNDPAAELVAELGWGPDGSDPSMGAVWDWSAAGPNPGWNDAAEPNNDEYWGDIVIDAPGTWDYAARLSGDGGMTWVYCDLDDLLTGGYTPDQAGSATVR